MVTLICAVVGVAGSAFPVDIDEIQLVGHLKKAIKAENSATITCDAKDLQLFLAKTDEGAWLKSKDLLRMRKGEIPNEVESRYMNEELEDPTDKICSKFPSTILDGTIHVLVVVPKQGTSAPIVSQDGVFDHCSDPFFSQFSTVDQVGDWLEFSSLLPLTRRQTLYIRSSYQVIADQALLNPDGDMVKYAVITGTPGIGKSVFIYYVMWRLIKEKKRVLFLTKKPAVYFDGSAIWDYDQLPKPGNRQFWSPDLWCLVDSVDPTGIAELPIEYCSVLLASTPRRDCIGEFKKLVPTPDVFYMPLWTTEELAKIAPMYPHAAAAWQNRFECLGGVPRLVLQDIETDPQVLLESACNSCSLDECKTLVSINSEINSRIKIAQTLIHIHSQEPYRLYNVAYASELAMQVIARTKLVSNRLNMESFLSSCNGNPLAQSLCGYIFEPYCLRLLHEGGLFKYRELFSGAKKPKQKQKRRRKRGRRDIGGGQTIEIPSSSQPSRIVEQVEVGQLANQLYVPRTSNYAAIDAWMPHFGGFQITVGKKHDIKGGAADDLAKLGPNGNRLFFLLPPLYYKSFTKKTPQTIEQFAILVPYPEQV